MMTHIRAVSVKNARPVTMSSPGINTTSIIIRKQNLNYAANMPAAPAPAVTRNISIRSNLKPIVIVAIKSTMFTKASKVKNVTSAIMKRVGAVRSVLTMT